MSQTFDLDRTLYPASSNEPNYQKIKLTDPKKIILRARVLGHPDRDRVVIPIMQEADIEFDFSNPKWEETFQLINKVQILRAAREMKFNIPTDACDLKYDDLWSTDHIRGARRIRCMNSADFERGIGGPGMLMLSDDHFGDYTVEFSASEKYYNRKRKLEAKAEKAATELKKESVGGIELFPSWAKKVSDQAVVDETWGWIIKQVNDLLDNAIDSTDANPTLSGTERSITIAW